MKHCQKGDDLKPADDHVNDKYQFCRKGECPETPHWSDLTEPWSDIAKRGGGADQTDYPIAFYCRDGKSRNDHDEEIEKQKSYDLLLDVRVNRLEIEFDWLDDLWVNDLDDFPAQILCPEKDADNLDPPSRRAGTPADEHHAEEYHLAGHRP